MSVPKSFISYMKIMRDYYKSGATTLDPLPKDFNFDDIELDASSYGFIGNDNFDSNINNNIKNNQQSMPSNVKLLSKNTVAKTEITTIDLFAPNDSLKNIDQQLLTQTKATSVLAKKFKTAFSTIMANFSQKSK